MDPAEREAALEAVLRELLSDPDAPFQGTAVLYQDFLVRCRMRRIPGQPPALSGFKRRLAVARAGIGEGDAPEGWERAQSLAGGLDEDRARDWVVLRVLRRALRAIGEGARPTSDTRARLTACVAIAKAVQD